MKPKFVRQDAHKKVRLGTKWRRPKGLQSKQRLRKSGHSAVPSTGYGRPPVELPVVVHNLLEITGKQIIIARTVGNRKKIEIMNKAKEMGIEVIICKKAKSPQKVEKKKDKTIESGTDGGKDVNVKAVQKTSSTADDKVDVKVDTPSKKKPVKENVKREPAALKKDNPLVQGQDKRGLQ